MSLNKSQLLAVIVANNAPVLKTINGVGDVYFKKLTVAEQGELAKLSEKSDNVTASLNMVAFSLCDEKGKRLFDNGEIGELGKMSTEHLTEFVTIVSEINGFGADVADVKKN